LTNGIANGPFIIKDKWDNTLILSEFINGVRWNGYKEYSPLGTLYRECTFYNGDINGLDKIYDIVGNLRYTSENLFGIENGKYIRYYHNNSKMQEYQSLGGLIEGEMVYYNQKGEAVLKVGYSNNEIKYYISKDKTGELTVKTPVQNETANIVSNYPNGKTAVQITYIKGNLEGKMIINNTLGKPEYEANYSNSILNGNRIEYYANGKIYKKENFVNNDFEGVQEYFKEDGKKWLTAEYKKDQLHGNVLIYTNGKVSTTKKYNSNELVEIIK
jgi:antitoxin component YwqK of YwqJK toxin-antitoxin module